MRDPEVMGQTEHEYKLVYWPGKLYEPGNSRKCIFSYRHEHPVVSTLQHPLRIAISWISRENIEGSVSYTRKLVRPHEHYLTSCIAMWDSYINFSASYPIILFNINCEVNKRTEHLLNIINQIDIFEKRHIKLTENFVEHRWFEFGAVESIYKKEYITQGTLPDVYDWSRFDRAINWYNKKIKECKY